MARLQDYRNYVTSNVKALLKNAPGKTLRLSPGMQGDLLGFQLQRGRIVAHSSGSGETSAQGLMKAKSNLAKLRKAKIKIVTTKGKFW